MDVPTGKLDPARGLKKHNRMVWVLLTIATELCFLPLGLDGQLVGGFKPFETY